MGGDMAANALLGGLAIVAAALLAIGAVGLHRRGRRNSPRIPSPPLSRREREGRTLLLAAFVVLLGGRFTLDRLDPSLPALDLRIAAVAVIAAWWLVWWVAGSRERVVSVGVGVGWAFLVAWGLWLVTSAGWAPTDARATDNVVDVLVMLALLGIGLAVATRVPARVVDTLWWAILGAGLVYFAAAAASGPDVQGRWAALGGGPNVFARVMGLAVLAAIFLAVQRGARWPLLTLPALLYGLLMSGSRGGMVALAVVGVLFLIPVFARLRGGVRAGLIALIAAGVVAAPRLLPDSAMQFVQRRLVEQTINERYSSGRSDIWAQAWEQFGRNPIIGAGIDGYYGEIGRFSQFQYPHNLALATLAEAGIVGAVLLALALGGFAVTIWRRRPLPPSALMFAVAGLLVLTSSMFSGDYYDSRFIWLFLGLSAAAARRAAGDTSSLVAALRPARVAAKGNRNEPRPSPAQGRVGAGGRSGQ